MRDQFNLKDVNQNRRETIRKIVKFLPVITGGALIYPLLKYVNYKESSSISLAISLEDLKENITKKANVLIVKKGEEIKVYSAKCPHMGCILNIDNKNKKFVCPCHSSEFGFNGKKFKGPAKKDLVILEFKIENKILYVNS